MSDAGFHSARYAMTITAVPATDGSLPRPPGISFYLCHSIPFIHHPHRQCNLSILLFIGMGFCDPGDAMHEKTLDDDDDDDDDDDVDDDDGRGIRSR
ncbi:uncharacterized protein BO87DRAFT_375553 [Aspergillus neoniger CBS 115656]|uniref:Uncharacterized protein n=1 Tax=Aspergillus neoniger (strain CBS 115656) TaxID=1448310 RepID=A0A318Z5C8_ASPNB|nr:hypothetical protein BO87DRAFT_375553 [Aspergillus neoniger CBS 115656]PYH35378.1 hypothetical protein BO87DRAFT_375553 [Aspergillus neoniger CBS 115656]